MKYEVTMLAANRPNTWSIICTAESFADAEKQVQDIVPDEIIRIEKDYDA